MVVSISKELAECMHNLASYALVFGYDGVYNTTNRYLELGKYRIVDRERIDQMCDTILFRLFREYSSRCVLSRNDGEFLMCYNNVIRLKMLL